MKNINDMRKLTLFTICLIVLIGLFGCDNLKCSPSVKPNEYKEKTEWIFGGKCSGKF